MNTQIAQTKLAAAQAGTHHGFYVGAVTKQSSVLVARTTGRALIGLGQYLASFGKNTVVGFAKTSVE